MGPTIHAEVGDAITVVFRNNTRFPVGIHPHGVLYAKASEGAHYVTDAAPAGQEHDHGNMPETGANVVPKGQYTYHWDVPERAGPGPSDPSSVIWLYHAHDHEGVDIYAGLVGAIVVTRSGGAKPDGIPKDVDREFVTLFMIIDENASPYLDANIQRFAGAPRAVSKMDGEFKESNKKHTINGLLYGNLDGLTMRRGERVRWYLIGLGNENDIHTAHWHGNTVLRRGSRTDTVELFPATTEVVDVFPGSAIKGVGQTFAEAGDRRRANAAWVHGVTNGQCQNLSKAAISAPIMPSPGGAGVNNRGVQCWLVIRFVIGM